MPEKIVGILGGMGPEATVDLFQKILRVTPAKRDQDHLRILIDCNSKIPDRNDAALHGGEDPFPILRDSALGLEKAGADLIAIPCNAAHCWHREVQGCVRIPILHIMEATADYLKTRYPEVRRVGLLAAPVTVRMGLYQRALEGRGLAAVLPDAPSQERVLEVIRAVKAGQLGEEVRRMIRAEGEQLAAQGAQAAVAGCTEIPIVLQEGDLSSPVVDATLALALRVVREARG
jgi:aspartate racemase